MAGNIDEEEVTKAEVDEILEEYIVNIKEG